MKIENEEVTEKYERTKREWRNGGGHGKAGRGWMDCDIIWWHKKNITRLPDFSPGYKLVYR